MANVKLRDVVELIGVAAIVASLIFIGLQMRQDRAIAMSQVWSDRNLLRAEMASLIHSDPQIWINGLQGSDLSETESVQFEAIAFLYFSKEGTHFAQRQNGLSPDSANSVAYGLASMIRTYPGLKVAWSRWIGFGQIKSPTVPFSSEVERQMSEMDAGRLTDIEAGILVPH